MADEDVPNYSPELNSPEIEREKEDEKELPQRVSDVEKTTEVLRESPVS